MKIEKEGWIGAALEFRKFKIYLNAFILFFFGFWTIMIVDALLMLNIGLFIYTQYIFCADKPALSLVNDKSQLMNSWMCALEKIVLEKNRKVLLPKQAV